MSHGSIDRVQRVEPNGGRKDAGTSLGKFIGSALAAECR
jgi:hypothetical protein